MSGQCEAATGEEVEFLQVLDLQDSNLTFH